MGQGRKRGMLEQADKGLLTLTFVIVTGMWVLWSGMAFLISRERPSFLYWLVGMATGVVFWLVEDVIGARIEAMEQRIAALESQVGDAKTDAGGVAVG